jgi:predicted CopG family antitoxin
VGEREKNLSELMEIFTKVHQREISKRIKKELRRDLVRKLK